jgi:hypothetical protein
LANKAGKRLTWAGTHPLLSSLSQTDKAESWFFFS